MKLYDARPQKFIHRPLHSFKGQRCQASHPEVFQSFYKAKKFAQKALKADLQEVEREMKILDGITEENCPTEDSPFRE